MRCPVRVRRVGIQIAHERLPGNYRYYAEDVLDPISITAGLVQTGLYLDFFYQVLNLASCSATPDVSHYVPHLHLQGSPGPEVRVASMTLFDPQPHPVFHLHNAGFVPCAARKVVLEPAHVSIVIRLSIYTRARTVCPCTRTIYR
jgi:hypothetical protein